MVNFTFSMAELETFLLIVVRVTCFMFAAPFFGMNDTPRRVKIGLGVLISVVIYRTIPVGEFEYNTVLGYSVWYIHRPVCGCANHRGVQPSSWRYRRF